MPYGKRLAHGFVDLVGVDARTAERVAIFRLLLTLSARLRSRMDRRLAASGLTTQQAALLTVALDRPSGADAEPTMGLLADRLGVSHQNVRQLVDALTRKGLVAVQPDARDRRVKRVLVSPKVRRLFAKRNADDFAAVASWFDALSQSEIDVMLRTAIRLLRSWDGPG